MGLLISKVRLKAACGSMHQFVATVRGIVPDLEDAATVEAATAFLYLRVADEVFGPRFTMHLRDGLRDRYRAAPASEIEAKIGCIAEHAAQYERMAASAFGQRSAYDEFTDHVRAAIKALLAVAGLRSEDSELIKLVFPRFENAVRRIKSHLEGIRRQNPFVMRTA